MNRRALIAALIAAPLVALAGQAATVFRDIPAQHWARKPAVILADAGVFPGRTPVDFSGEVPLTRYELAVTLSKLFVQEGPPPTFLVLRDMRPGHEATLEVQRVIGFELLPVRKPGVFDGDGAVTRVEMVKAMDTLLDKNGVSPPARKPRPVFFSDIPTSSPLFPVLDRVVNRFGLLEAAGRTAFQPNDVVTRFQFLAVLIKGMAYLNPPLDREIKEATRPTPGPSVSLEPGETPRPTATPLEFPTYMPMATFAPSPVATWAPPVGGPILRNRARANVEAVLMYAETLPQQAGAIAVGEQPEFSGFGLPGGGLSAAYWGDRLGATLDLRSYFVGLNVPDNSRQVEVNMLDTFVQGYGWYKIGSGPAWEAALGVGGFFRNTYNMNGALWDKYYLTVDKNYFGGGPGLATAYRFAPEWEFTGQALLYPMLQTYQLPRGSVSVARFGADLDGKVAYKVGPWSFDAGLHAFLSGAFTGGSQVFFGPTIGAGMAF